VVKVEGAIVWSAMPITDVQ